MITRGRGRGRGQERGRVYNVKKCCIEFVSSKEEKEASVKI